LSVLQFSETRFLGSGNREHLHRLRAFANELGVDVEIGIRSICPTSTAFDASAGTAEEQLTGAIEAARLLGSPLVRCFVGRFPDRLTPGGIERRIGDTIAVLRSMRSHILDSGVKIAIENHAGDLQARELLMLVEEAGADHVGVCLDSGNPLWALEDPHLALDLLAPHVLTSHIRDGVAWNTPEGAAVAWTRMGDGAVGIEALLDSYVRQCPSRALLLEVIVTDAPRLLNYRDREFWTGYDRMPSWEFVRFQALADRGAAVARRPLGDGETAAGREIADVDASIHWTRAWLARANQEG
jgi:3-oxoisoapionate decarboxylase